MFAEATVEPFNLSIPYIGFLIRLYLAFKLLPFTFNSLYWVPGAVDWLRFIHINFQFPILGSSKIDVCITSPPYAFQFPILGSVSFTLDSFSMLKYSFNSLYWVLCCAGSIFTYLVMFFQFPILGSRGKQSWAGRQSIFFQFPILGSNKLIVNLNLVLKVTFNSLYWVLGVYAYNLWCGWQNLSIPYIGFIEENKN